MKNPPITQIVTITQKVTPNQIVTPFLPHEKVTIMSEHSNWFVN